MSFYLSISENINLTTSYLKCIDISILTNLPGTDNETKSVSFRQKIDSKEIKKCDKIEAKKFPCTIKTKELKNSIT